MKGGANKMVEAKIGNEVIYASPTDESGTFKTLQGWDLTIDLSQLGSTDNPNLEQVRADLFRNPDRDTASANVALGFQNIRLNSQGVGKQYVKGAKELTFKLTDPACPFVKRKTDEQIRSIIRAKRKAIFQSH